MKRSSSNDPKTVLLVIIIVVIGVLYSSSQVPILSWAVGSYPIDGYERNGDYYSWTQDLSENPQGFEKLVFETINGKVTVEPQTDDNPNVDIAGTIKIKKGFFSGESSVLNTKEKTGIEIIKDHHDLKFKVQQPRTYFFGPSNITVDLVVKAPKGYQIAANTVNGTAIIRRMDSAIEVHSVNGTVRTEECQGPVSGSTVNGNAEIMGIQKSFRVSTVNGSVQVKLSENPDSGCEAKAVNGSVKVTLLSPFGLNVDLGTVNGKAEINGRQKFEGEMKKKSVHGKINGGGQNLRMNAVNGSVRIE